MEDAGAEYLAYFADKTVTMVRAPDEYTYPAPFNLIELAVSAPMKYVTHSMPSAQTADQRGFKGSSFGKRRTTR